MELSSKNAKVLDSEPFYELMSEFLDRIDCPVPLITPNYMAYSKITEN